MKCVFGKNYFCQLILLFSLFLLLFMARVLLLFNHNCFASESEGNFNQYDFCKEGITQLQMKYLRNAITCSKGGSLMNHCNHSLILAPDSRYTSSCYLLIHASYNKAMMCQIEIRWVLHSAMYNSQDPIRLELTTIDMS